MGYPTPENKAEEGAHGGSTLWAANGPLLLWHHFPRIVEKYLEVQYNTMVLSVIDLDHKLLNQKIRALDTDVLLSNCCGQRFIAAGMREKHITIDGTPGNALGAYLDGAVIEVNGNAQDAVGDTMNDGTIIIHGNIGDAAGYAMRGGKIYVQGDAGYRAGIHMKAYKEKVPVMIIGGKAGSFLGEYQAGGVIIVLGLSQNQRNIVGNFPCTGMHGGKMILRGNTDGISFPHNVCVAAASALDREEIQAELAQYCQVFGLSVNEIMDSEFTVVTPDSKNPYKQMYVAN